MRKKKKEKKNFKKKIFFSKKNKDKLRLDIPFTGCLTQGKPRTEAKTR